MSIMTNVEFQQPSFTGTDKPKELIENPHLANVIGFAEKEHTEVAIEAMHSGRFQEAASHIALADAAGKKAGIAYLDDLRRQLDGSDEVDRKQVPTPETESSLEQWANDAKQTLAEKYNVFPKDFELFTYEKDGTTYNTVVYTAANGIDLGNPKEDYDKARSWNKVMDKGAKNKDWHTLTIDGVKYDDREGMTYALYDQLVEAAKKAERPLPDSKDTLITSNGGDKWYSWTMMTGEPLTAGGNAPIAGVDDGGSVRQLWADVDRVGLYLRFRPAVIRSTEDLR